MSKVIATGDLFQGGRIDAYDPSTGLSFRRYAAILDPADNGVEFNFPNAQATGNVFGSVRSVFVDNSLNDYELRMTVAGTRQTFPIPAKSTGVYNVDTQLGSTILVDTAGLSTGAVEIIFYNYPQSPVVWYKNGTTITAAVTIGNGDDAALGATTSATITNPATNGTLIAFTRGILTGINSAVVALASLITNTNAFSYRNITTSTTTVVKNAPGVLGKVTVNTTGGAGTIIVYDNTAGSGSIIATLNSAVAGSFDFGAIAATGITVVTTGAPDVTILYR